MIRLFIIGGGPAAVSVCLQVTKEYQQHKLTEPLEIIVFEKGDQIGPGLPYSKLDDCYILNLPKDMMEPVPGTEGRFTEWLRLRTGAPQDTEFPPRHYFGEYLHFLAEAIKTEADDIGISIKYHTNCEVFDIEDQDDTIKIVTNQGDKLGDYLVLCTGHMPSSTYSNFAGRIGYFHNPWEEKLHKQINPDNDVVIIGTRLTAIDVVRKLFTSGHRGKVTMVSRSGLLPTVLSKDIPPYKLKYLTLANFDRLTQSGLRNLSLKDLAALSFAEINEAEGREVLPDNIVYSYKELSPEAWLVQQISLAEFGPKPWQQVLFAAYPIVPNIWAMLSLHDKKIFLKNYKSTFLTYLAAFPLENAYKLREYLASGQLNILGGITEILGLDEGGFSIHFKDHSPLVTKILINATGAGYEPVMNPLYKRMIEKGLLEKHEAGGINVDPITFQVYSPNIGKHSRIFAVGEITMGVCLATTDMSRVAIQSGRVALTLARNFAQPPELKQTRDIFSRNGQAQRIPTYSPELCHGMFFKQSTNFLRRYPIGVAVIATLGLAVTAEKVFTSCNKK